MAGTAIFVLLTTILVSPALWLLGMPADEVLVDRMINIFLVSAAASQLQRIRDLSNQLLRPLQSSWMHQALRPTLGIGGVFGVQTLVYTIIMLLYRSSNTGLVIGLANLLGGSTMQWVWDEKWRWIVLVWRRGSLRVTRELRKMRRLLRNSRARG